MDEEELVKRCRQGDPTAWRSLVDTHSPYLARVIAGVFASWGIRPSQDDLDDAFQEFWFSLSRNRCQALGTYRPVVPLRNWLALRARSRALDWLRTHARDLGRRLPVEAADGVPHPEASASSSWGDLEKLVNRLGAKEQILLRLFYAEEKSYSEIAALTGIPMNSIGPMLSRALQRLRDWAGKSGTKTQGVRTDRE